MFKCLQMIRHILFDADQTLYPASSGMEAEMIRRMNLFTAEFLGITVSEAAEMRSRRDRRYESTLDWLRRGMGLTDTEAFFRAVHPTDLSCFFPKNEPLKEMLSRITVPCSVFTNSWETHAINILEYLEISPFFTHIFDLVFNNFSGKAAASSHNNVLSYLGLNAEEVLFIDDIPRFAELFSSLGGNVILVDEDMEYSEFPHARVRRITDIGPVLKEYRIIR